MIDELIDQVADMVLDFEPDSRRELIVKYFRDAPLPFVEEVKVALEAQDALSTEVAFHVMAGLTDVLVGELIYFYPKLGFHERLRAASLVLGLHSYNRLFDTQNILALDDHYKEACVSLMKVTDAIDNATQRIVSDKDFQLCSRLIGSGFPMRIGSAMGRRIKDEYLLNIIWSKYYRIAEILYLIETKGIMDPHELNAALCGHHVALVEGTL